MKSLVIYFSKTDSPDYKGNTEVIAEYIREFTGAVLFKCIPVIPYSDDYGESVKEAHFKQDNDERPALKSYLDDISDYDVIYIGGPIYWGEFPFEIYSELDRLNFEGKIVMPFATHDGSGMGLIEQILAFRCKGADVRKGLPIEGKKAKDIESKELVNQWILR